MIKKGALDETIARLLFEEEATRRSISVAQLIEKEMTNRVRPVTDEEARAVYETASDRYRNVAEAEALRAIATSMFDQRLTKRRMELVAQLRERHAVKVLLDPPRVVIEPGEDSPARGPKDASVTIVEFSEFQCPYCARVVSTLSEMQRQFPGKVRLVFRHLPLAMHKEAAKAAEAAVCAHEQGRFWEMHDRLFENQQRLQVGELKGLASELGLDLPRFNTCLDEGRHAAAIQRDKQYAERFGITGTPAFFINGRLLTGAQPAAVFASVIEEELRRSPR